MNFSSKIRQDVTVTELVLLSQFMLEISSGVDQITGLRWELAGCLLLAWVIVYCALWRGIKSIGKVGSLLHLITSLNCDLCRRSM